MAPVRLAGALVAATLIVGACGSDDSSSNTASSKKTTTTVHYAPSIDPANFTNKVTNRYWPLTPGTKTHFEGTSDGEKQTNDVFVTNNTKTIMGVKCVVVHDQ